MIRACLKKWDKACLLIMKFTSLAQSPKPIVVTIILFFILWHRIQDSASTECLAPLRILKKILYLKPALLIICTHELLWMVLIAKIFLRCPVVYDIRENYFRNILYTNSFPPILRVFIALYVRIKEWITIPVINIFFLAEAGYAKELSFVKNKKVILENKVKKILLPPAKNGVRMTRNIHLLFSGTLAPTTGIFVAIDLATKLHALEPNIRLHIVGFSPMAAVYQRD